MTLQKDIPTIAKAMAQLLLYTDNGKGRGRDERGGEDSGSERGAGSGKGEGRRKAKTTKIVIFFNFCLTYFLLLYYLRFKLTFLILNFIFYFNNFDF